jgi:hypothetical protein
VAKRHKHMSVPSYGGSDCHNDDYYDYGYSAEPKGKILNTHEFSGVGFSPGSTVKVLEETYENGVVKVTRTTKFSDGKETSYSTIKSPYTSGWMKGNSYTDYYGSKKAGQSISSGWSARYGKDWWQSDYSSEYAARSGRTPESMECDKIISSVRRSANVVYNSNEEERTIKVKWADGKSENNSKDECVYISPDVVVDKNTRRSVWDKDERADVLIAEVMSQSTMKRTMDPYVEERMLARGRVKKLDLEKKDEPSVSPGPSAPPTTGKLAKDIWYTAEVLAAEQDVLSVFPGFSGYFASHRDYYTDEIAYDFIQQQTLDENVPHAVDALRWSMLHPEKNLVMPPTTEQAIEYAMKEIALTRTSEEREVAAYRIAEEFVRLFKLPPEAPSYGDGDGDGEGKKSGGVSFGGSGKGGEKLDPETLKKILEMMQNGQIPKIGLSEERGSEAENEAGVSEDPDVNNDPTTPTKPGEFDDDTWCGGTEEFKIRPHHPALYKTLVAELQPQIRALRNRLKIQNEEQVLSEHGLKKGRLDEGSLYRLGFIRYGYNDDRLFEESVIKDRSKLAVGLLVDESGSMRHDNKWVYARDAAITIVNALKELSGVEVCVFGHTSEGYCHGGMYPGLAIHNYYTPEHRHEESLASIHYFGWTIDGYALSRVGKHLYEWYPDHNKLLIMICDGEPHSCTRRYDGMAAKRHVRGTVAKLARFGIKTLNVGIGSLSKEEFEFMYGKGHSVILGHSSSAHLMAVIGNAISYMVAKSASAAIEAA